MSSINILVIVLIIALVLTISMYFPGNPLKKISSSLKTKLSPKK